MMLHFAKAFQEYQIFQEYQKLTLAKFLKNIEVWWKVHNKLKIVL